MASARWAVSGAGVRTEEQTLALVTPEPFGLRLATTLQTVIAASLVLVSSADWAVSCRGISEEEQALAPVTPAPVVLTGIASLIL